ncbi:MAG TPA: response regulator transcription factor [Dissulfurispiraceae bacterium]|nr:response regulator transcription factor [Dissulfurispiraceae bacterium]
MEIMVMLAEDHRVMRDGLRHLLDMQENIRVVGVADNGRMAVSLAEKCVPDVIIMDVAMPDLNGVDATRQILERCDKTRILALSMHSDSQFILGIVKAGASGYLLKDCSFEELLQAIRAIAAGRTYFGSEIAGSVINECLRNVRVDVGTCRELTGREREVLQLLAEGKSSNQISRLIGIHERTVDVHRHKIMNKLNIRSVAELTKYAIREGLTSL